MFRQVRPLFLPLLLLGLLALACNFGQSVPQATPTPTVAVIVPLATEAPLNNEVPASPAPEIEAEEAEEPLLRLVPYENEAQGLSFQYPQNWAVDDSSGFITLASSESLLSADQFGEDAGGMLIAVGPGSQFAGDRVEDALLAAIDQAAFTQNGRVTSGPELLEINNQEAASAVVEGADESTGQTLVFQVTLIRAEERAALLAGISRPERAEQFRPIFELITGSIRLSAPPLPEAEGVLEYGETVQGTVPDEGASAWRFTGTEGETVDLLVEPTDTLDVTVDVLESSGRSILEGGLVDEAFGVEQIRNLHLPQAGEYLVVVRGFAGAGGSYRLTLSRSNSLSGGDLALGESVSGEIAEGEAADYLFISPDETQVTAVVDPDGDLDVVVELLDPETGTVLNEEDASLGTETLTFTPEAGGDYLLRVRGFTGEGGSFTLSLTPAAYFTSNTVIVSNLLEADAEGQIYPFAAAAGEPVVAQVVPEEGLDVVLEIWDADSETLLQTIDLSQGTEEVNFSTPATGNYYLRVSGFEGQGGDYTLTLGGTGQVIFEVTYDDVIQGTLTAESFLDYSIRLEPGQTLQLTVEGLDQMDPVVALLALDETLLLEVDVSGRGVAELLAYTAPADVEPDSVFLIRVREYDGNPGSFTMTLEE